MNRRFFLASLAMSALVTRMAFAQTIASKVNYIGSPRHLKVVGLKVKDTGLLNIAMEIENSDNDDQQGYYRVAWVGSDGFPAWEDEAWKPVLLHGGQRLQVMIVAPTPKARDFKIEFTADRNTWGATGPASN